jgi:hypothetical protein
VLPAIASTAGKPLGSFRLERTATAAQASPRLAAAASTRAASSGRPSARHCADAIRRTTNMRIMRGTHGARQVPCASPLSPTQIDLFAP